MKQLLLVGLLLLITAQSTHALDEAQERRVRSGLRLFRALLAADEDIASKTNKQGKLVLLLVYVQNQKLATDFAEELRQLGQGSEQLTIRGVPIDVQISNDLSLETLQNQVPAGIFLVENLYDADINRLVQYSIIHHIILYSPFDGDVNRGVLGGLAIETRVRPYINMQTMRASEIRIKDFFLKVAKQYEP